MQTTIRLKAHEIGTTFLKTLQTMFAGEDVEITVKSLPSNREQVLNDQQRLIPMVEENLKSAPVVSTDIDLRALIDDSQYPADK